VNNTKNEAKFDFTIARINTLANILFVVAKTLVIILIEDMKNENVIV